MADAFGPSSVIKTEAAKDPNRIMLEEPHLIDEALAEGVRDALLRHRERGLPVVIQRDGKIVWVSAEELLAE
jgi:hypothetical protein